MKTKDYLNEISIYECKLCDYYSPALTNCNTCTSNSICTQCKSNAYLLPTT